MTKGRRVQEKRLLSVALVLAAAPALALPSLASGAGGAGQQVATAVLPPQTRVAFTDERDQLYRQDVSLDTSGVPSVEVDGAAASYEDADRNGAAIDGDSNAPTHVGELSSWDRARVFVSTQDADDGDVYLRVSDGPLRRVTCDSGVETHPVVFQDEETGQTWIAYASNSDQDEDGQLDDYDVYVALPVGGGDDCDAWQPVNLTDVFEGDDLWPAWYDDTGADADGDFIRHRLVFSTADPEALPDLASTELRLHFDGSAGDWEQWDGDPAAWSTPELLTSSGDTAETQPAVNSEGIVAFTTTEDRPDGSLRLLDLDEDVEPPSSYTTWEPWVGTGTPPSSSEAAWQYDAPGDGTQIAYTTRQSDQYGDIGIARVEESDTGPLQLTGTGSIAATPGVAETHAAWTETFGPAGTSGTIVYTGRAQTQDLSADTDRILDADVSDVRIDGSGRTVRVDETVDGDRADEAGPDYSPDGTRIAYSRSTGLGAEATWPEREIWVAAADGSGAPESLAELTGHSEGDRDRDPVWSPDGTRLAFVRESAADGGRPSVWVVRLDGSQAPLRVTPTVDFDDPSDQLDHRAWLDTDPDWSPDSSQLVLRRTLFSCCVIGRPAPGWAGGPSDQALPSRAEDSAVPEDGLWIVPVQASSIGSRMVSRCGPESCVPVTGRHPVWDAAADVDRIAYVQSGRLFVATRRADPFPADGFTQVFGDAQLTGIRAPEDVTESGFVLSDVQEPAWSPDGTELAFSGQPIGQPDQRGIYRISADGTGLLFVTDGRGPETEPSYQWVPTADVAVTASVTGSPAVVGAVLTATFTVTNNGPEPATDVALTTTFSSGATTSAASPPAGCEADGSGCLFGSLATGESRTYTVTFTHGAPVPTGTVTGAVSSTTPDPDPTDNEATASYLVAALPTQAKADVRVRIRLDGPTGYVGGKRVLSVGIRNLGPAPAEDVQVRVVWPALLEPTTDPADLVGPAASPTPDCLVAGDPCPLGDLPAGGTQRFAVVVRTPTEGGGTIVARASSGTADPVPANNRDTDEIEVLQPSIRLVPAVARPGQVVLAYGEDMPPGTDVLLGWSKGIVLDRGALRVAEDGTIRQSVIIVRRDQQGDRTITATSASEEFSPVTGDVLVVPRSVSPPEFLGRG